MVATSKNRGFCVGPIPSEINMTPSREVSKDEGMPSFMQGFLTPIMACVAPPINSCVAPHQRAPPPMSPLVDQQMRARQQMTDIVKPHANDVICGRGASVNRHVGNHNFRSLVAANKEVYVTLTKKQKMLVARKIVETIYCQSPPGRFLQKDPKTGLWFDIGLPRSLEKTSQALREKQTNRADSNIDRDETRSPVETRSPALVSPSKSLSPPSTPTTVCLSPASSVVSSPKSGRKVEAPPLSIPRHLETQFMPRRHYQPYDQRYNQPYDEPYGTPTPVRHPYDEPYGPPTPVRQPWDFPPQQPFLPSAYAQYRASAPPPPPPPLPRVYPSTPMYPAPAAEGIEQMYTPLRRSAPEYVARPRLPATPSTPPQFIAVPPRLPRLSPISRSRQAKGEVSPGRAQQKKKRRTQDDGLKTPSPASSASGAPTSRSFSLSREMQARLILHDHAVEVSRASAEVSSPSQVLQSKSRRVAEQHSSPSKEGNELSGLAALSSAALLKLDEARN